MAPKLGQAGTPVDEDWDDDVIFGGVGQPTDAVVDDTPAQPEPEDELCDY